MSGGPDKKLTDAVSMGATFTSAWVNVRNSRLIGLFCKWTGTSGATAGTITVEISPDYDPGSQNTETSADITGELDEPITSPAGTDSSEFIDLSGLPYKWVRYKYTRSAGSGTMNAWILGKDL